MSTLTRRQSEVLDVIRNHIQTTGAPPTRAEIAKTLGFRSVNAAEDHLKALARKGAINLVPGTSRGIQLAKEHGVGLPIIQVSHTDIPIFSEKHIQGRLPIQTDFFHPQPDYLLKMQDDMPDTHVKKGDYLLIHNCHEAPEGKLVVGRMHHQLVIKRYIRHESRAPLALEGSQSGFILEGLCVGLIRAALL